MSRFLSYEEKKFISDIIDYVKKLKIFVITFTCTATILLIVVVVMALKQYISINC